MPRIFYLLIVISSFVLCPAFAQEIKDSSAETHLQRAMRLQIAGDTNGAIAEYKRALEIKPNSVDGHMKLGELLLDEVGDLDGAISEYVTALSLDPACLFCQMHLDEAVEIKNSSAADSIQRGNDYYRSNELNRAIACYRIACAIDPNNADAHNSLAWTLYRAGKLSEGLLEVQEALRLKAEEPEYVNTLACILFDKGDIQEAIASWHKAISLSKRANPADLYGLAIGSLSIGDTKAAVDNFKEAIKADPNYADANYLRDKIGLSIRALASHDKLVLLSSQK
jgi:tetratricopeptide (TPR) repeat protein